MVSNYLKHGLFVAFTPCSPQPMQAAWLEDNIMAIMANVFERILNASPKEFRRSKALPKAQSNETFTSFRASCHNGEWPIMVPYNMTSLPCLSSLCKQRQIQLQLLSVQLVETIFRATCCRLGQVEPLFARFARLGTRLAVTLFQQEPKWRCCGFVRIQFGDIRLASSRALQLTIDKLDRCRTVASF